MVVMWTSQLNTGVLSGVLGLPVCLAPDPQCAGERWCARARLGGGPELTAASGATEGVGLSAVCYRCQ